MIHHFLHFIHHSASCISYAQVVITGKIQRAGDAFITKLQGRLKEQLPKGSDCIVKKIRNEQNLYLWLAFVDTAVLKMYSEFDNQLLTTAEFADIPFEEKDYALQRYRQKADTLITRYERQFFTYYDKPSSA